jgi:hypothetical protein
LSTLIVVIIWTFCHPTARKQFNSMTERGNSYKPTIMPRGLYLTKWID